MASIDVTDPVPVAEEPEIASAATTGPGPAELHSSIATTGPAPAEPHSSDGSGRGDGSEASYPWSLPKEQQVHNMKKNWRRAFTWINDCPTIYGDKVETIPWFASVVENLQANPSLDNYEFEMETSLLGFPSESESVTMSSLAAAILMGDLKMVRKILEGLKFSSIWVSGPRMNLNKAMRSILHSISETPMKAGLLYTPLHLAVAGGDCHIVDEFLHRIDEYKIMLRWARAKVVKFFNPNVNVENWLHQTPLDLAWKLRDVTTLQKLLRRDEQKKDVLHVAVRYGDIDLMRAFMSELDTPPKFNRRDRREKTPMHYLATIHRKYDVKTFVDYLCDCTAFDVTALDGSNFSIFYVAVLSCNTKLVMALLDSYKNQIRLNEACDKHRGPPIQIAFEGGHSFKDIQRALTEQEPVKGYMDTLYRDRQVFVDAANAILVGAALIASVTFASWLQPPLNYTSYFGEGYSSSTLASSISDLNYVDVEHNIALRAFWVFNDLSFYFAIATVVCGTRSVLPKSHLFIKKTVDKLGTNLLVTSSLLACSVLFVIVAFAIAGTIVLTPLVKYRWCMIVPTLVGGMVCIVSLIFLVKSMRDIYFGARENGEGLGQIGKNYLKDKGYIVPSTNSDSH